MVHEVDPDHSISADLRRARSRMDQGGAQTEVVGGLTQSMVGLCEGAQSNRYFKP